MRRRDRQREAAHPLRPLRADLRNLLRGRTPGAAATEACPAVMSDKVPPKLFFGPCHPPEVEPGARLFCELRGSVVVRSFTNGPIPWPRARMPNGLPPIIVCGDLARAIRTESLAAVAYWW